MKNKTEWRNSPKLDFQITIADREIIDDVYGLSLNIYYTNLLLFRK